MTGPSSQRTEVLIAGAGPTGLVLALWLTRLGVRLRIIDKTAEAGTTSRAVVVQARTLEQYRQLGVADAIVAAGHRMAAVNLWVRSRRVARGVLGDMGAGISPYPYALIYPQDEHEQLLITRLGERGVHVERRTELLAFEETAGGVRARIARPDGSTESLDVAYIAGCDGAHSVVREALQIGFPGGLYEHLFYVADVEARGDAMNGELHVDLDTTDFLVVFPLKGENRARLIGTVREEHAHEHDDLTWDDVSRGILESMRLRVERVHWFSTYHVHHRVAGRFRSGRAFLAGDAAHIHSPVGGQGMNTGIGDAANLAWKLAAVVRGRAAASLLDSYEPERIAFARRLVATTDRVFTGVTSPTRMARLLRLEVVPRLVPALFRVPSVRRFMFRSVSQTEINYRGGALSEGRAGRISGGDRLPWVAAPGAGGSDNFAPLTSLDWQVHVYGDASPELRTMCGARQVPLHVFAWRPEMGRAGLRRDALYLIRPDGYVALADPAAAGGRLDSYLDARGLAAPATGDDPRRQASSSGDRMCAR
jgi:2-polyprenyl-6-methoxyphenol hydroxylase-like FAD-dependent oxidoreductase